MNETLINHVIYIYNKEVNKLNKELYVKLYKTISNDNHRENPL